MYCLRKSSKGVVPFREDVDFWGVELLTPIMKGGSASIYSISQHDNCCKLVIIPHGLPPCPGKRRIQIQ